MGLDYLKDLQKSNDNKTDSQNEKLKIEKIWDKPDDALTAMIHRLAIGNALKKMHDKALNRGWWIGFIMGIALCTAAYAIVIFNQ